MDNAAQPPGRPASTPPWTALGMLAVLIFAWGGNYTWISIALRDIGPWTFTAVRYVGAAIVIAAALALHRGPGHMMPVRGERARLAGIGLLQGATLTILRADALVNFAGFFPDGTALVVVRLPDPAAAVATLTTAGGWDRARLTAHAWSQTL